MLQTKNIKVCLQACLHKHHRGHHVTATKLVILICVCALSQEENEQMCSTACKFIQVEVQTYQLEQYCRVEGVDRETRREAVSAS